ncbi:MAG: hypothetical protein ACREIP_07655, partial [Alphaproteobacteria bacterium]
MRAEKAAALEMAPAPAQYAPAPFWPAARRPSRALAIPPRLFERWQEHADLLAELVGAPAALIRIAEADAVVVAVASRSDGNPYAPGESMARGGLYCEIALDLRREIALSDAVGVDAGGDDRLRRCAAREHGMPAYMGSPIFRPDGTAFGTLCVLDRVPRHFESRYRRLLLKFRDAIQADVAALAAPAGHEAEDAVRGQAAILEMIAAGAPLSVTLGHLIALMEAQMAGAICSVLLLDDDGVHI